MGSGEFVERVLKEADARTVRQDAIKKIKRYAERVAAATCKKDGISLTELRSGSRRGKLPAVRVKIVQGLVEDYGVPIAPKSLAKWYLDIWSFKDSDTKFVQLVNSVPRVYWY